MRRLGQTEIVCYHICVTRIILKLNLGVVSNEQKEEQFTNADPPELHRKTDSKITIVMVERSAHQ